MADKKWYALRSAAHKEGILHRQVVLKGIESFFPSVKVNPVNPRAVKRRPLFPNYMFVKTDLEQTGRSVFNYLPFSHGLVEFGGQPAIVPDGLVWEIQRKVEGINTSGGIAHAGLEPGVPVRVVEGPFRGYEGLFDMRICGSDRVLVLLDMLNRRQMRVEVNVGSVRSAH